MVGHFAAPPFGAPVEVVQALCAAGLRVGVLQAIHQGQRIADPGDTRLDQVFRTIPGFRSAAFELPSEADVPLEVRVDLAQKLEHRGQPVSSHSTGTLAAAVREAFGEEREAAVRVAATLEGMGIAVPPPVVRTRELSERLSGDDDIETVKAAHNTWADLMDGCETTNRLDGLLADDLENLRRACIEASKPAAGLVDESAAEHAELVGLLSGGDLAGHAARIIELGRRLTEVRQAQTRGAALRLIDVIQRHSKSLSSEFDDLEGTAVAEALRPLEALMPPDDLAGTEAGTLIARIDSADHAFRDARRRLEELRSEGRLSWVRASEYVTEPIATEEEIDPALGRLREAIADELAEGKQVRLQ